MSEDIREVIKIIRNWDPKARVILFGSRARKDYLKSSDYDLIIISERFRGIPFPRRASFLLKMLYRESIVLPLDLLCYTPQEFDKKSKELGIVSEALNYGVEL